MKFSIEPYQFETLEQVTPEDGSGRYYILPSGEKYYSVTTILGRLPKEYLEEWKRKIGESAANKITKQAAQRGTNLHKIAEDYLLGNYDQKVYMPRAIDMFKPIMPLLDKHITKLHNTEFPLYSHRLKTAGNSDLLAEWDGVKSIIDFKTSKKRKKLEWITSYFLQTACYAMMVYERIDIKVPQLVLLISVEDDPIPQVFIEKTEDWILRVVDIFVKGIYDG